MSDRYQSFVSHGIGKRISTSLNLPRPAVLKRFDADAPLLTGPIHVVSAGSSRVAGHLPAVLTSMGVPMALADDSERLAAVLIDATGADHLVDLADLPAALRAPLRSLRSSGRVVVLGTAPTLEPDGDDVEVTASRQALDGFTRALAKELRAGATANLVLVEPGVTATALESTLRFLLSGRSAYVDGQPIRLNADAAPAPADWARPLAGKVALVTGAARGIGAAIAQTLARDGAQVICADLPAAGESLSKVANQIGGTTLQLDISAPGAADQLAAFVRDRFGGLDILVHNAGVIRDRLLANMKPDVWSSVLDINLGAQLRINHTLLDNDLVRHDGRIVCLSSTSGIAGNRGQTNYAASKAGIIGMVRATVPRLRGEGSTINAIAPGFIETDMTARMPFATREVARRLNSLQQAGLPIDVAEAAAWLVSPGAGAVTGQVLRVCGQNLVGA
jgi:3-oxoacyl-[acyl-carrier protein] reductase